MSVADNKAIAQRFIQAWNAGGQPIVDELAAPEITVSYEHWSEPARGPESFKQILSETFAYFPDMQITVEEIMADGEKVMVHWRYTGTHRHGELFGMQPAGKQVRVPGFTIYKISNGKVIEESGLVDSFSLMLQLGAVPAPAGS